MGNFQENEGYRRLINSEIDKKYPGLSGAVNRVKRVTTELFRPLRPDVEKTFPPLLLCNREKLKQESDRAYRETTREDKPEERGIVQLEIFSGVILASDYHFQKTLLAGPKGFQFITGVLAEEYIHALTAFGDETSSRVGFAKIPNPRHPHLLEPGKIYEHDIRVEADDVPVFTEDPREIRLTENFTRLAVNLMLNKLLPDATKRFDWIILYNQNVTPQIIQSNDSLLSLVLKSLVEGNERIIVTNPKQEKILQILDTPGTKIYAASKIPADSADDVYSTSSCPISFK